MEPTPTAVIVQELTAAIAALLLLAAVVGFSRVALGVHCPGDVLVGQAIALLCAWPMIS